MFDDLEDVEEFTIDPRKPGTFVTELLEIAKSHNPVRGKQLLGALDDGLEAAVHAAGEGGPGAREAFAGWLQLLIQAITALAEDDMGHFIWEAPGKERLGASFVRRLQCTVNSGTFDSVKVARPLTSRDAFGVVLMLGRGGVTFDDLEAAENWWREQGYVVIQANHCCIKRLKEREIDRILKELAGHNVTNLGLIGHFFSENGSFFWCHVMERWEKCPPSGLPPLERVLRGCIYDSCYSFAGPGMMGKFRGASGEMVALAEHRKNARKGSARHVTMNATLAMARNVFGYEDARTLALADLTGPFFKGLVDFHAHRGSFDDPVFLNGGEDQMKAFMREPDKIPRMVFVSKADATMSWNDANLTVLWMQEHRGAHVQFTLYDFSMNCSMHKDDPSGYFSSISEWNRELQRVLDH